MLMLSNPLSEPSCSKRAGINQRTGDRLKAQFYLVEYFPMTLQGALDSRFPRQVPPFKWTIAIVSDVRARTARLPGVAVVFLIMRCACVCVDDVCPLPRL
jgi:hypothetical protein